MNYWVFKHKPGTNASEDKCVEYVKKALKNNCCLMQYEKGSEGRNVKTMWDQAMRIRESDIIFLYGDKVLYAWGKAVKPRHTDGFISISKAIEGEMERAGTTEWVIFDVEAGNPEDTKSVFYQNLSEGYGSWGERVDVECWNGVLSDGKVYDTPVTADGDSFRWALRRITEDSALKLMEALMKEYLDNNQLVSFLENSKNIVLTGAPGTGKTYKARNTASNLVAGKDWEYLNDEERKRIGFVQFHQSYDYTDFVEGLRPLNSDTTVGFTLEKGVFKTFCAEAVKEENRDRKFVFIIDEINRGEVSRILGELFFSIDPSYRGENGRVKTQYQNMIKDETDPFYEGFYVPENVYLIGTMNDIDRSVDSLDFAFRRRFNWIEITAEDSQSMFDSPDAWKYRNDKLSGVPGNLKEIKSRMDALNSEIIKAGYGLGEEYQIGATYFLKYTTYLVDDSRESRDIAFDSLWDYNIAPILREYLRGTGKKIENLEEAYQLKATPSGSN